MAFWVYLPQRRGRWLSLVAAFSSLGVGIQNWIFNNFMPASGEEVQSALQHFSRQARTLTGPGIAFLATTAWLMLKNIEQTFNRIWHTRTNRKGLANFLLYRARAIIAWEKTSTSSRWGIWQH